MFERARLSRGVSFPTRQNCGSIRRAFQNLSLHLNLALTSSAIARNFYASTN
jgi:hypothetical protein